MINENKKLRMEEKSIADTYAISSTKNEMMGMLILAGTVLCIAFGAYKNKYAASGKFFGLEFNLSPQNHIV